MYSLETHKNCLMVHKTKTFVWNCTKNDDKNIKPTFRTASAVSPRMKYDVEAI